MFEYPVELIKDDNGTVQVNIPDVPEANTFGNTVEEALDHAVEALEAALSFYVEAGDPLPKASAPRKRHTVRPSLQGLLKLSIYKAMLDGKVRRVDLSRRLGVAPPQIDRLIDLTHASRIEQLEKALKALGSRVTVQMEPA